MSDFNEKLKEVRITEIFIVLFVSLVLIIILDIDETWMYVIAVLYVLFRTRHYFGGLKEDFNGVFSKISSRTWLLVLVTNILFSLGTIYLFEWILGMYPYLEYFPIDEEFIVPAGFTVAYLIDFIATVIVAPISEEFIFRAIMLNRLDKRLPLIIAIILSSFIFGFMHGFAGLLSAFLFGVCMCIVYLKTQNIFVSISIHFMNNLLAMILDWIPGIDSFLETDIVIGAIAILAVISFVYIMKFIINGYREITSQVI